jgi:O-antigen/teichoic acid export membrane protein
LRGSAGVFTRIVLLRAVPGGLNLLALMYVALLVDVAAYGQFSLGIAVATAVGILVGSPVTQTLVANFAIYESGGKAEEYLSALFSFSLLASSLATLLGGVAAIIFGFSFALPAAIFTFCLHNLLQEILRAQLREVTYAAIAVSQSVSFVGLCWLWVSYDARFTVAMSAFALSYGVSTLLSLLVLRLPRPQPRRLLSLKDQVLGGAKLSVAMIIDQASSLGLRAIAGVFGGPDAMGTFSFALDLSQRSVGFLVGAASFSFVPRAFKADAGGHRDQFNKILLKGGLISALAALVAVAVMVAAFQFEVPFIPHNAFAPLTFVLVSCGIAGNRLVKLLLYPHALRLQRLNGVVYANAFGAAVTLCGGIAMVLWLRDIGAGLAMLCGSFAVAVSLGAQLFVSRDR